MPADGRWLEQLVAFIENSQLPPGFVVRTNRREYLEDGAQLAEFDLDIRGRVGTTDFAWLIECRDRPSNGPAPGAWIEQLCGRHQLFDFDRVTAVSTTGYSPAAQALATRSRIELREVRALTLDAFSSWLGLQVIRLRTNHSTLEHATFLADSTAPPELLEALQLVLRENPLPALLRPPVGQPLTPQQAFMAALNTSEQAFEGLTPGEPDRSIEAYVPYLHGNRFNIDTPAGAIEIPAIRFRGKVSVRERDIPLVTTTVYARTDGGLPIAEMAAFEPVSMMGGLYAIEIHRLPEQELLGIRLRRIAEDGPNGRP